ncbi:MAG: acyltransferase family protein [Roseburia sp.]|nr:acyltransferase family protein [Roseburia sp.]
MLRIFATVGVICIHAGIGNFFTWANAVFVMISGALWLEKEEINLKILYTKNILRIVTAFVFWSAFYAFFHSVVLPKMTGEYPTGKEMLVMLIQGRYHLWFCYLIVGIYIGLPFWKKIAENEMLLRYFLIVAFVFSFLIPCIQNISKLEWTTAITQIIHWDWAEYVFYFMSGYFLQKHHEMRKNGYALFIYILGIVSVICIVYAWGNSTRALKELSGACLVFVFFINLGDYVSDFRVRRLVEKGSSLCFGVYLIHDFFLTIIRMTITFDGVGGAVCQVIGTFIASLATVWLIRKVPHIGRHIT